MKPYPNVGNGRKTVTTAGTSERISATNVNCRRVTFMALLTNTDNIVIGSSTVIASEATRNGIPLSAGQSITLDIEDLYNWYIDAVVSGEGITYLYQY